MSGCRGMGIGMGNMGSVRIWSGYRLEPVFLGGGTWGGLGGHVKWEHEGRHGGDGHGHGENGGGCRIDGEWGQGGQAWGDGHGNMGMGMGMGVGWGTWGWVEERWEVETWGWV
ncbi:hypothetical protein EDB89DRAFT_1905038 [Lactarius sanguifluus]|nr:hypothetical protein EDB89DRAFT_1905038 [Lactarius sanguifluus]